jgi:predicted GH43/DUF377 family glycosyl hydrolase
MSGSIFLILPAVFGATLITGLFVWGLWKVITSPLIRERFIALVRAFGEGPPSPSLKRASVNPILRPTHYPWESASVINPGAVSVGGRVHLFYRAIGSDGISRIGYASSPDGIHFDERLTYPVFALDGYSPNSSIGRTYMEMMYPHLIASGGSWGGVEDPRVVVIEDRLYLSFSGFYNWNSIRIGVVSLAVEDLLAKRFRWSKPVFLSPPNEVRKNWVLFPKKIGGHYALWHAFVKGDRRHCHIAYLDTLTREPVPYILGDPSFMYETNESVWDSRMRSAGPPPLETDRGWLLLYHANDVREPHKYKIGALLLDRNDPSNIIARSSGPILAPEEEYENDGKPGIVYACGACVRGDMLLVYYGGADAVTCVAETSLSKLLQNLDPH